MKAMSKKTFDMAVKEKDPFSGLLDELSASERAVVDQVTQSVNRKVAAASGYTPASWFVTWGPYLAALVPLSAVLIWALWPAPKTVLTADGGPPGTEVTMAAPAADVEENPMAPHESAPVMGSDLEGQPQEVVSEEVGHESEHRIDVGEDGRNSDPEAQPHVLNDDLVAMDGQAPGEGGEGQTENPADQPLVADALDDPNAAGDEVKHRDGPIELALVKAHVIQKSNYSGTTGGSGGGVRNGELSGPSAARRNGMLPEEMPKYPGGDARLEDFLASQVDEAARANPDFHGKTAAVSFVVTHKGKISDIEAKTGSPELRKEAERIVSRMGNWSPGTKKGKIQCTVTITFQ